MKHGWNTDWGGAEDGDRRAPRPTGPTDGHYARLLPSRDSSVFNPWLKFARIHFTPALAAAAGSMCWRAQAAHLRTAWSLSDKVSISIGAAALALVSNCPL